MSESTHRQVRLDLRGNDLDPSAISDLLGGLPTEAARIGEPLRGERGVAKTGFWCLREVVGSDPNGLEEAIGRILSGLTDQAEAWEQVRQRFGCGLVYSITARKPVDGLGLGAETIKALARRGLSLSVAIY